MGRKAQFAAPWMEDEEDRLWEDSDLDFDEDSNDEDFDEDFDDGAYEFSSSKWQQVAGVEADNDDYTDHEQPDWKSLTKNAPWYVEADAYLEKPSRQNRGRHGRKKFSNQRRRR